MKYIAAVQTLAILAALAFAAYVAWKLFGKGAFAGADWLKQSTPLGAPSRAIDAGISAAIGREETLGGWLADLFNPSAREVNNIYRRQTPPADPFFGPSNMPGDSVHVWNPVDTELRRLH